MCRRGPERPPQRIAATSHHNTLAWVVSHRLRARLSATWLAAGREAEASPERRH